ncbi:hypothetical protein IGI04_019812 [Brassica rapa subsp. trilocularis]|uniref:Uncharacterized protein n=1 Tax=Brassica rapa subsp. trilocularis TaxID=1813537 RepID=A0ABQ7MGX6_BRACM|nr:hypothetical protein IGI04_019812 [Brassica rapa subsp. trilocularis]
MSLRATRGERSVNALKEFRVGKNPIRGGLVLACTFHTRREKKLCFFRHSVLQYCRSSVVDRFCLSLSSIKDLPGLKPDSFEGSQWDGLGFFVQYLWLISGGIAAGTYNEGATDFKETPIEKVRILFRVDVVNFRGVGMEENDVGSEPGAEAFGDHQVACG